MKQINVLKHFLHRAHMQKPVFKGLAFVFCSCLFFCCQHYDPKSQNSQDQSVTQQEIKATPGITESINQPVKNNSVLDPGLPISKPAGQIVKHFAYTLSYNEEHEIANWVAYVLKPANLQGTEKRSDDFREDPAVRTQSADPDDYKLSGYDRGHLVPAGDMKWNKKAMSESFLMSNITPQTHAFNAGIWETLESQVRSWVKKDSQLYIVTGPVLQGNLQIIGKNKVTVPEYYYKAVLDANYPEIKCIAFIIPNKAANKPLMQYNVTVDSLENLIDIDLFPGLPDDIENAIEKTISVKDWKTTPKKQQYYRKRK
ncbi:MAG: DNA/RNA non-specific endonuclease [Sphingobacteriales bacterium]|nr:MAG: DNA/RNA non-specific endonuclease [Sphingobacteriales bacterium]